jgi:hypothetical protein
MVWVAHVVAVVGADEVSTAHSKGKNGWEQ